MRLHLPVGAVSMSITALHPAHIDGIANPWSRLPTGSRRRIDHGDHDSLGNTSEFSACVPYSNDTIFASGFDLLF